MDAQATNLTLKLEIMNAKARNGTLKQGNGGSKLSNGRSNDKWTLKEQNGLSRKKMEAQAKNWTLKQENMGAQACTVIRILPTLLSCDTLASGNLSGRVSILPVSI